MTKQRPCTWGGDDGHTKVQTMFVHVPCNHVSTPRPHWAAQAREEPTTQAKINPSVLNSRKGAKTKREEKRKLAQGQPPHYVPSRVPYGPPKYRHPHPTCQNKLTNPWAPRCAPDLGIPFLFHSHQKACQEPDTPWDQCPDLPKNGTTNMARNCKATRSADLCILGAIFKNVCLIFHFMGAKAACRGID